MVTSEEREFEVLKAKINKLVSRDIEFNEYEVVAISKLGHADSMKDLSWLCIWVLEDLIRKYNNRRRR